MILDSFHDFMCAVKWERMRNKQYIIDRWGEISDIAAVWFNQAFGTYIVIVTFFKWQFIVASTPTTVPCMTVPFFNSIVTCSRFSFCKNFTNFILCGVVCCRFTDAHTVISTAIRILRCYRIVVESFLITFYFFDESQQPATKVLLLLKMTYRQ